MKNSNHRKEQCQNKNKFTFFHAYVLAYHKEPGGTVTVRTRELNLKFDVFRPMPGHDVLLPSGVVYNFEGLYKHRGCKDSRNVVGVLTEFFENNISLRSRYDLQGALACNETRDEEMFPEGCTTL